MIAIGQPACAYGHDPHGETEASIDRAKLGHVQPNRQKKKVPNVVLMLAFKIAPALPTDPMADEIHIYQ